MIFAGTTEGRRLSEWLSGQKTEHVLCVATQYGEQVLSESPYAKVLQGRLTEEQMLALIQAEQSDVVVDATHPYASEATENIRQAASAAGADYLRLEREESRPENLRSFPDTESCAAALAKTRGNILLTTGSKELAAFCADPDVKERLVVRVLPGTESISLCEKQGIPGKRIIAMQGPFSREMNRTILQDYDIRTLVTKESGAAGGFAEKCAAAKEAGCALFVIARPGNAAGASFRTVQNLLAERFGLQPEKVLLRISLIGCGMGDRSVMTNEAAEALADADIVFGAKRLLEDCRVTQEALPYYLAKDILPVLRGIQTEPAAPCGKHAAVLFSGDTGFYSGAEKLYAALKEEISAGRLNAEVEVYPGVSSVSALAAKFAVSWQDAKILSIHGAGTPEKWSGRVLDAVRHNAKTFLLLSGLPDLKETGKLLCGNGLTDCRILAGYCLASEQEQILELSPCGYGNWTQEGLYSVFILNPHPEPRPLTHGLPDSAFLRDKVPMTKEEIRAVCIAKLGLREDSVFYDIGSGTGSIAVEAARLSPDLKVFAVERKPEAAELICRNMEKFGVSNIRIIRAYAPEGLADLPAPTHVFLGGTGGKMKEILQEISKKTEKIRIVATAVSFETLQELLEVSKDEAADDFEICSVAATRTRTLGQYHMLQGENPIWIASWMM